MHDIGCRGLTEADELDELDELGALIDATVRSERWIEAAPKGL